MGGPGVLRLGFLLCLAAAPIPGDAVPPRPSPHLYATANYGLTFRSPPGTTYCPLPRDWVGSDHGTVLFLERPRSCGGTGYPSSSRNFEPAVARIELYYGFVARDDPAPLPRCAGARIPFAGARRPICIRRQGNAVEAESHAYYALDPPGHHGNSPSEAIMRLVTRPDRLGRDLALFRRFATTVRTCTAHWPAMNGYPSSTVGVGRRCPNVGTF
jgi:hypothetical protein